jgi:hypothetical protein
LGQAFSFHDPAWNSGGAGSQAEYNWALPGQLFIELFGNSTTNWTGSTNQVGNVVWLDLSGQGNHFTNAINTTAPPAGGMKPPKYSPIGPNGYYVADFSGAGNIAATYESLVSSFDNETNQPVTIFMVASDDGGAGNTLFDCATGGRESFRIGTSPFFYAGTTVSPPALANSGNWFIYSMVFTNGGSFVRTNGVLLKQGNTGTGKLGRMMLGQDISGVTAYVGKIAAVLAYGQNMATNYMQYVESNLNAKFNLGYHAWPN